ncbi:MAG: isoprenoid biosynthesis glyoxalase ElbB [Deltaproteobacteria bacterium]|nr:isoprenoid biosynthesis glyoxalase ElbB [Deltaproteobacteria bacterium]
MDNPTLGVILSGAGHLDGSDVHETVLIQLSLAQLGVICMVYAPDLKHAEIDHATGEATGGERSVLREAARLARGPVKDLARAHGTDHEGWLLPGGGGAAKTLSDFAARGAAGVANREVNRVLREAFAARIPVGASGVAALLVALVARASSRRLRLTLGDNIELARTVEGMGHAHITAGVQDVILDGERKVATTPAGLAHAPLDAVAGGLQRLVKHVVDWSREEISAPRNAPR